MEKVAHTIISGLIIIYFAERISSEYTEVGETQEVCDRKFRFLCPTGYVMDIIDGPVFYIKDSADTCHPRYGSCNVPASSVKDHQWISCYRQRVCVVDFSPLNVREMVNGTNRINQDCTELKSDLNGARIVSRCISQTDILDITKTFEESVKKEAAMSAIYFGTPRADFGAIDISSRGICQFSFSSEIRSLRLISAYMDGIHLHMNTSGSMRTFEAGRMYKNKTLGLCGSRDLTLEIIKQKTIGEMPHFQLFVEATVTPGTAVNVNVSCQIPVSNSGFFTVDNQSGDIFNEIGLLLTVIAAGALIFVLLTTWIICAVKKCKTKKKKTYVQSIREDSVHDYTSPNEFQAISTHTTGHPTVVPVHVNGRHDSNDDSRNTSVNLSTQTRNSGTSSGYSHAFDHLRESVRKQMMRFTRFRVTDASVKSSNSDNSYLDLQRSTGIP